MTLLGVLGVGKTSLIEQFMSSEHSDVFSENHNHSKEINTRYTLIYRISKIREKEDLDYLNRILILCNILLVDSLLLKYFREVIVDVDGCVSVLVISEVVLTDFNKSTVGEDYPADCTVVVYSVDMNNSFGMVIF